MKTINFTCARCGKKSSTHLNTVGERLYYKNLIREFLCDACLEEDEEEEDERACERESLDYCGVWW